MPKLQNVAEQATDKPELDDEVEVEAEPEEDVQDDGECRREREEDALHVGSFGGETESGRA